MRIKHRMTGRRVEVRQDELCRPGDYGKDWNGEWRGCTPTGLHCWLKNHHVEEHDDGTISVVSGPWGSNSILVNSGRPNAWHGLIDHGEWRELDG